MSAVWWWLVAWCVVSLPAALVICRVIGRRDRQVPVDPERRDLDVLRDMLRDGGDTR